MPKIEVSHVYEVKGFPTALMPSAAVGQLNFSTLDGKSLCFLMPRDDFQRLGRKIAQLLAEIPPPARKRTTKFPTSEK